MLASAGYFMLTALGIGFIIFVHELGHFLAARAVGVRVEAFSIGFGPKLFGFQRGPTDYKLCLIPLGGYVKMAGEDPTRPTTGQPDEFGSKKVWQRTLVISAGVIMNIVFSVVAIPIAFSIGVPFDAPVAGFVAPDSAAWEAGIRPGDRFITMNDRPVLSFEDVITDAAVGGDTVTTIIERDGKRLPPIDIHPKVDKEKGLQLIGVARRMRGATVDPKYFEEDDVPESQEQLRKELQKLGIDDATVIKGLNGVPISRPLWEQILSDPPEKLTLQVDGKNGIEHKELARIVSTKKDASRRMLRLVRLSQVKSLAGSSESVKRLDLKGGDVLLTCNGWPVGYRTQLSRALGGGTDLRATLSKTPAPDTFEDATVTFVVLRDGKRVTVTGEFPDRASRLDLFYGLSTEPPKKLYVGVTKDGPADRAGVETGAIIEELGGKKVTKWSSFVEAVGKSEGKVELKVAGNPKAFEIEPDVVSHAEFPDMMIIPEREVVQKAFPESLSAGFVYTVRTVQRVLQTLKSIVRGSVSAKNLGGIITIFQVSKYYSKRSITRGLLFLAVISINLAIINILPIPVLDGGWLVFLIIERIKGSPVSERVMGYAQWTGLFLILGLIGYVTWNDIVRWFL